ncbi:hypothetical protein [Natronorubrum sp. DTA28]|uniref:hypothetical protein n=1 Tax=Natronorubrum sp. DTA28 TaxID=3447019 RepID=UPI003F85108C
MSEGVSKRICRGEVPLLIILLGWFPVTILASKLAGNQVALYAGLGYFAAVFYFTNRSRGAGMSSPRSPIGMSEGGTERFEASSVLFDCWMDKASANIEKWGLQDEETLLLAIQEELGELTQAHLEARDEGGDPGRVDEELDDLGALLLQLHESRNNRSPQAATGQKDGGSR